MPPVTDPRNVYREAGAGRLRAALAGLPARVYVPNSLSDTVSVIDPATFRTIAQVRVGKSPQHVVPSYDLHTLWVNNNGSNTLTPIDPVTGQGGRPVPVDDPYNLYFTPDGAFAMIVAEARHRLDFRHPQTMALEASVPVPCPGANHLDFSADGRFLLLTCEFAGRLVKLDTVSHRLLGVLELGGMPQDVRLSPDGRLFVVADMVGGGVHLVKGEPLRAVGFLATGTGAHGVYPSRDGRFLYVANRGWTTVTGGRRGPGSVAVVDPVARRVVALWPVPGGGSPDMGNVSADGRQLWLSGRYDGEVYAFDTDTGRLLARIPVGAGPHGLTYWPQPGRYSLGHTGNMR
ncbi:MAG: YncE family protein [Armatimonadota bacterium]|nr:YncE family protein [Armatimonadota bacterium]